MKSLTLWLTSIIASTVSASALPQVVTNGQSVLGTLDAPTGWSDPHEALRSSWPSMPRGQDRVYTFNITRGFVSPDGVNTSTLLVNGGFPGPTIEANYGDSFMITVNNQISNPETGTTLHWHGLFQKDTPFMDGVPSVTSCPIAPGDSFVYRFTADRIGTGWWHSHFSGQTTNGLYGAMIIYGPSHVPYDVDVGPIMLSDRFHTEPQQIVNTARKMLAIPSDNNLINGKARYNCAKTNLPCSEGAEVSRFRFQSGRTHRLRLINTGSEALQYFTIDEHELELIALDFNPVKPVSVPFVALYPGQRADVLVRATGLPNKSYWMRSDISVACAATNQPHALAAIHYEDADTTSDPDSSATAYFPRGCSAIDLDITEPHIPQSLASDFYTENLNITQQLNADDNAAFYFNNRTFHANYSEPLMALTTSPDYPYAAAPLEANLFDFYDNTTSRVIIRNFFTGPHPMHLHGHDFQVLAQGVGEWDGTIINPHNPIRRDTTQLEGFNPLTGETGFAVIQTTLDNPGIWGLHCHLFSHMAMGMYTNYAYHKNVVETFEVPEQVTEGCKVWNEYVAEGGNGKSDAGLR